MGPYYWTIALVTVFTLLAERFSNRRGTEIRPFRRETIAAKTCLFFAVGVLIFVAGCRFRVGTDYGAYYKGLTVYGDQFEKAIRSFDEPGLPLLAVIIRQFTDDGAYFVFACSLITIALFMKTAYKNEKDYCFSTLLFILAGMWTGTFNGVRQFLASAILFAGHRYIYEKKFWKYLFTVFLAASFHISAVVMIVLYFLLRNRITVRNTILLAVGTAIVSANYDAIFSFIGFLKDSDVSTMTEYKTTAVNTLRILVACAPAVTCLIIYYKKELTAEQTFYINSIIIHGAGMIAASNSAYLARIGIYTSPFIIIAIPKLIHMKDKLVERVSRLGITLLYAIYCYIDISVRSSLNHFQWIWERVL